VALTKQLKKMKFIFIPITILITIWFSTKQVIKSDNKYNTKKDSVFFFRKIISFDNIYSEIQIINHFDYEEYPQGDLMNNSVPNRLSYIKDTLSPYRIIFWNYRTEWFESSVYKPQYIEIFNQKFCIDSLFFKNYGKYSNKEIFSNNMYDIKSVFEIKYKKKMFLTIGIAEANMISRNWYWLLFEISKNKVIYSYGLITNANSTIEESPPYCFNDFNNDGRLDFACWSYKKNKHVIEAYTIAGNKLIRLNQYLYLYEKEYDYYIDYLHSNWKFEN